MAYDDAPLNTMVDYNQVVLAQQLDDGVGTLNKIVEGHDTLSKMSDVLAQNEEEGIDPTTAQMASVAVESICKKLGINSVRAIPALESFESQHTRIAATSIAQEGIGSILSMILEGVVKAIKYVLKILSDFMSVFINGTRYTDRAVALLRESIKEKGMKEATLDDPGVKDADIYDAFYENKYTTSPDTVIEITGNTLKNYRVLEDYAKLFESFTAGFNKTVAELHRAVDNLAQGKDQDIFSVLEGSYDALNKTLTSFIRSKSTKGTERDLPKHVKLPDNATGEVYLFPHTGFGVVQAMAEVDPNGDDHYKHLKRIEYNVSDSHEPGIVPYPTNDQAGEILKIYEMYNELAKKGLKQAATQFTKAMASLTNEVTVIRRTIDSLSFDGTTELTVRAMSNKLGDLLITVSNDYSSFFVRGIVESDRTFHQAIAYLSKSQRTD